MYFEFNELEIDFQEPVSLEEAKKYLRIDENEEDKQIITAIKATREFAEKFTSISLLKRRIQVKIKNFIGFQINLKYQPDPSSLIIKIDNSSVTMNYIAQENKIIFDEIINASSITIDFYTTTHKELHIIKQAMLAHLEYLLEERSNNNFAPTSTISAYNQFRKIRI